MYLRNSFGNMCCIFISEKQEFPFRQKARKQKKPKKQWAVIWKAM